MTLPCTSHFLSFCPRFSEPHLLSLAFSFYSALVFLRPELRLSWGSIPPRLSSAALPWNKEGVGFCVRFGEPLSLCAFLKLALRVRPHFEGLVILIIFNYLVIIQYNIYL